MGRLSLGVVGTSRKPDESRLPIHPRHLGRIDPVIRSGLFLERGYGARFGITDEELSGAVGGLRDRARLLRECDVVVLPKPLAEDLAELSPGQTLWGWPHCVQNEPIAQIAIDRRLTLIAWEAMNHWTDRSRSAPSAAHRWPTSSPAMTSSSTASCRTPTAR